MDLKLKKLVKDRATSLFPIIRDQLNLHYELNPAIGSCFKFLFLVNYGPKRYLQEFNGGDLKINLSDVRDVFFDYAEYVPGGYGLQEYEANIVVRHNSEVDSYLSQKSILLPYRSNSIGLANTFR